MEQVIRGFLFYPPLKVEHLLKKPSGYGTQFSLLHLSVLVHIPKSDDLSFGKNSH
jgi:hypothetical protein